MSVSTAFRGAAIPATILKGAAIIVAAVAIACGPSVRSSRTSAGGTPAGGAAPQPAPRQAQQLVRGSQLVIYARETETPPFPVAWDVRKIALDSPDGSQVAVPNSEISIKTSDLDRGQIIVVIADVPEGNYSGLTIFTRGVFFEDSGEPISSDANYFSSARNFSVVEGNATTLLLVANLAPPGADRTAFKFQPAISIEETPPPPKGKIVYVVNELSSNISIIDKSLKRVISNVFVGSRPSAIASDQRRNRLYIADRRVGALYEMDMISQHLLKATQLNFVDESIHIEPLPTKDMMIVVNFGSDTVYLVDAFTLQVMDTVEVGDGPVDAVYSPIWDLGFVVNLYDNSVSVIDFSLSPPEVDTTIYVELRPTAIAIDDGMGWLYVTNGGSTDLSIIKIETMAIERTMLIGTGAGDVELDPYGRRLFISMTETNEVLCADPYTGVTIYSVRLPSRPGALLFDPDERNIYAAVPDRNAVVIIDAITREIEEWIETGEFPVSIALRL